ncbi:MAG: hypothetical protein Q8O75_02925, partial [bacterium]|nr:hypothetical protein [bacterium]
GYNLKFMDLINYNVDNLETLGVERGKCLIPRTNVLYYAGEILDINSKLTDKPISKTNIYQFNLETKSKKFIAEINGGINDCFQVTSF